MHASSHDIAAYLRTVGPDSAALGYTPARVPAGTTYGDPFDVTGAKSAVLTAMVGSAAGTPTAQSVTVSLESSADGTTWTAVEASAVVLDEDESSASVGIRCARLPQGHGLLRVKAVVAFTGGTSPQQAVSAAVVLAGYGHLPA